MTTSTSNTAFAFALAALFILFALPPGEARAMGRAAAPTERAGLEQTGRQAELKAQIEELRRELAALKARMEEAKTVASR